MALFQNLNDVAMAFFDRVDAVNIRVMPPGIAYLEKEDKKLLVFKRQYYRSFSRHFREIVKDTGRGNGYAQTMNLKLLKMAERLGIESLVIVMEDGAAYETYIKTFINYYEKYKTDVPHLDGEVAMPLDYFMNITEGLAWNEKQ